MSDTDKSTPQPVTDTKTTATKKFTARVILVIIGALVAVILSVLSALKDGHISDEEAKKIGDTVTESIEKVQHELDTQE